ncbi:hypothetical protein BX600DRAFT_438266 [Xylariales sp. PMI_506]|nr:hypothetical protein BX600DRAFT_438266 [Xylariales sp. PMI_506]
MKPSVFLLVATASATNVQYYYDGGCSDYAVEIDNVYEDGSCFGYQWTGSNSANIATCSESVCQCTFYAQAGCEGLSEQASIVTGDPDAANCASNYGAGFQSFRCEAS